MNTMTTGRLLRAYLTEAKYETVRMLRTPAFALPFLGLPVALYLLFAVVFFGEAIRNDIRTGWFLFTGFAVFGVMGPALFGFGVIVATEREQGLLTLKRALPMPTGASLLAKMLMAMLFGLLVTITMIVAALTLGHLPLTAAQCWTMTGINVLGALPFCAIGLFIGTLTTAKSAPAFTNLFYLAMIYLSGIMIPLPASMKASAQIWPAYHLAQLAFIGLGSTTMGGPLVHVVVLAAVTLVFASLAIRRLARVG
jgi:ABC-2 type transport system permease protein